MNEKYHILRFIKTAFSILRSISHHTRDSDNTDREQYVTFQTVWDPQTLVQHVQSVKTSQQTSTERKHLPDKTRQMCLLPFVGVCPCVVDWPLETLPRYGTSYLLLKLKS